MTTKRQDILQVFIQKIDKENYLSLQPKDLLERKGTQFLDTIHRLLEAVLPRKISGLKILVKPNLLKAGDPDCVTSALFIISVITYLKERGATVTVGDSPAFGTAKQVLKGLKILELLNEQGVSISSLSKPQRLRLPCGVTVAVSKEALDAQLIVNLPRLKAHCQLGVTGAVKNLYGTVPGFRKALYHVLYGSRPSLFARIILEIGQILPETVSIMDACVCMGETGPTGGKPIWVGSLGASISSHALDTAFYHAIDATPQNVPVWQEAIKVKEPGSLFSNLSFPWLSPKDIKTDSFILPHRLDPVTFNPVRFIRGRLRSLVRSIVFLRP